MSLTMIIFLSIFFGYLMGSDKDKPHEENYWMDASGKYHYDYDYDYD